MDALRLLCLLAMTFYIAEQIAGQNGKPLGKWSAALADQFPKPLENDVRCKVDRRPMRICDPNTVLDGNTRNRVNDEIKEFENSTSHQLANCCPHGVFVVALLNSIVNEAHDKGQETVDIAKRFQTLWSLNNCSAVFVVSSSDKTCGLVPGDVLKQLLPVFNTNSSVETTSSTIFTGTTFQGELTKLIADLRTELTKEIGKAISRAEGTSLAPTSSSTSSDSTNKNRSSSANHPLLGTILFVLVTLLLL